MAKTEVNISLVASAKSLWNFGLVFRIIIKNKLCEKHKFMIQVLSSMITVTDEHHDCVFWSINEISKRLFVGYKRTTSWIPSLNATTQRVQFLTWFRTLTYLQNFLLLVWPDLASDHGYVNYSLISQRYYVWSLFRAMIFNVPDKPATCWQPLFLRHVKP